MIQPITEPKGYDAGEFDALRAIQKEVQRSGGILYLWSTGKLEIGKPHRPELENVLGTPCCVYVVEEVPHNVWFQWACRVRPGQWPLLHVPHFYKCEMLD